MCVVGRKVDIHLLCICTVATSHCYIYYIDKNIAAYECAKWVNSVTHVPVFVSVMSISIMCV